MVDCKERKGSSRSWVVLFLMITLFVLGCGGGGGDDNSTPTPTPTRTPTPTQTPTSPAVGTWTGEVSLIDGGIGYAENITITFGVNSWQAHIQEAMTSRSGGYVEKRDVKGTYTVSGKTIVGNSSDHLSFTLYLSADNKTITEGTWHGHYATYVSPDSKKITNKFKFIKQYLYG